MKLGTAVIWAFSTTARARLTCSEISQIHYIPRFEDINLKTNPTGAHQPTRSSNLKMHSNTTPAWRDSSTSTATKTNSKSQGISTKRFHRSIRISSKPKVKNQLGASTCNLASRSYSDVSTILQSGRDLVAQHDIREYNSKLKSQRSAFRDLTSVDVFSRQELALNELDSMLEVHLGNSATREESSVANDSKKVLTDNLRRLSNNKVFSNIGNVQAKTEQSHHEEHINDDFVYPLSSSSCSSLDEPKRRKPLLAPAANDKSISPRKATEKAQHIRNFVVERQIPPKQTDDEAFLPALWSLEPRVLSVETSKTGRRRYVVGNFGRLADHYWRKLDPSARHYYELIREGTPCRLYFDIEFCKLSNPDISDTEEEEMVTELIAELHTEFQTTFSITRLDRSCVVDLDSSTSVKFSRHLIVHLPNKALFEDTSQVGAFVKRFVGRLADEIGNGAMKDRHPTLAKYLFLNAKPSKKDTSTTASLTCFIDLGVYTRNRLFRILGSSKYGKPSAAALRLAEANAFPFPEGFANDKFYVPLQQLKISSSQSKRNEGLSDDETSAADDEPQGHEISNFEVYRSATDWRDHAEALAATFVVPLNYSKISFPILPKIDNGDAHGSKKIKKKMLGVSSSSSNNRSYTSNHIGPSPYPMLDQYVQSVLGSRGSATQSVFQGQIRAWSIVTLPTSSAAGFGRNNNDANAATYDVITYQMSRNRYCERIRRAHKSNNIMWNVDLADFRCWQSCHDPECRALQFKGSAIDLPNDVKEEVQEAVFEQALLRTDFLENANGHTGTRDHDAVQHNASGALGNDDSFAFEEALIRAVDGICATNDGGTPTGISADVGDYETMENDINMEKPVLPTNEEKKGLLHDNDDDAAFEEALLALNLSDTKTTAPPCGATNADSIPEGTKRTEDQVVQRLPTSTDDREDVNCSWDDALSKALETNPEQFP